jgi:hypothetical protein
VDKQLTLYDYVSFVVPGALILFTAVYGYDGWTRAEPGATGMIGLLAAAFVVGHVNAVAGNWLEPIFLGGRPGAPTDRLWGTLGSHSQYSAADRAIFETMLTARYGPVELAMAFRLGQTELQQTGHDGPLKLALQHLGFYRGMVSASLIAVVIDVGLAIGSGTELPLLLWTPVMAVVGAACVVRYRRFWRQFGDHLLRGVASLPPRKPLAT